jgi:class 3 adenylate cyclase
MTELALSERWILLADLSNSTEFFWNLMEAGKQKPDALFKSSAEYSEQMESIFGNMANRCSNRLVAHLGNTMGDGFLLVGRQGHGADHITSDAPRVLELARIVKEYCDSNLSSAKDRIAAILSDYHVPRQLPHLKMKVTLHHGYLVTMTCRQRFFGDTVNYCARIASAAFEDWLDGVVLTTHFFNILPQELQRDMGSVKLRIKIRYPACTDTEVYRLSIANESIWTKVGDFAD